MIGTTKNLVLDDQAILKEADKAFESWCDSNEVKPLLPPSLSMGPASLQTKEENHAEGRDAPEISAPRPMAPDSNPGTWAVVFGSNHSTVTAGSDTIVTVNIAVTLTGTLTGSCVGIEIQVIHPNGIINFQDYCGFTGTEADRSGTSLWHDSGIVIQTGPNTFLCPTAHWTLKAGTGGQENLHSKGTFVTSNEPYCVNDGTYLGTTIHSDSS